ncbi:AMP-binding protein [Vibrio splendidus]|uniref:Long-chain-fatty-acid--CoA ligase n=1 Tax=Vibrio splendidus TaxID=29497 RepID=A0A837NLU6_VIBSP|nr:class I adenylate-forming enzyme family protein [Vibrio splendidus]KPL93013.1 AMP-dependent synthetase [Vibrio splendidus]
MRTETHNQIVSYLLRIPKERIFLRLEKKSYTFGCILELCTEFQNNHPELIGKNCAIVSEDRESLAIYLPAIDSVCNSVFLQPNEINNDEKAFYQSAGVDYVIRLGNGSVTSIEYVESLRCEGKHKETTAGYILATSGTTGVPKLASYTLSSLTARAQKNIERGQEFNWGLSYDINRFAGLQVYLQAIVAGSMLVIPSQGGAVDSQVQLYANNQVNCLSATPSFWRQVLMVPSHKSIPLKRITLGGEISNQSLLNALSNNFPDTNIIHIYASTEAGVGFAVKDKKEGFPTQYLSEENGLGCKLKVKNGLLWIKSQHGCSNFVKGKLDLDHEGFINTGDLVDVKNERILFLGRKSGSINVGGNKVMPEKVESVLEGSPLILMANVFAIKNPVLGSLVSTDVIATEQGKTLSGKELKAELIAFCRNKLEAFEIPVMFKRVETIETNATGKKIRNKK